MEIVYSASTKDWLAATSDMTISLSIDYVSTAPVLEKPFTRDDFEHALSKLTRKLDE